MRRAAAKKVVFARERLPTAAEPVPMKDTTDSSCPVSARPRTASTGRFRAGAKENPCCLPRERKGNPSTEAVGGLADITRTLLEIDLDEAQSIGSRQAGQH